MIPVHQIEKRRLKTQDVLDALKTQKERNKLGQFATPGSLALDIVSYADSIIPREETVRFLDPAFGTGSFYSALLQVFHPSRIAQAMGYEVDSHYAREAEKLWSGTGLKLLVEDFTNAVPREADKANLIICNPPYVRHHHLSTGQKVLLQKKVKDETGIQLSGLAGLYCHYLLLTQKWMVKGGLAGWLIPSEFMDVNYGLALRRYLLENVTLLRMHVFDPSEAQFVDADVSSSVIWFRNASPIEEHKVEITYGGTLDKPRVSREISSNDLERASKWTQIFHSDGSVPEIPRFRLSDLFKVKRGLATGRNDFFILSKSSVRENQIPEKFLKPILPMPRNLKEDVIRADGKGNPLLDEELFLLSCNLSEAEVREQYPALWMYLRKGIHEGINEGYLPKHRDPWYCQENRPPAPFLCTYMGRRSNRRDKPFRFILNYSNATASNSYLMLYPKSPLDKLLKSDSRLYEVVWNELQKISAHSLMTSGRVYGGGLHKLEPSELASIPVHEKLERFVPQSKL